MQLRWIYNALTHDATSNLGPKDCLAMLIERITMTHVRIPLVEPFRISSGVVAEKDGIVLRVQANGLLGYGEASPM